MRWPHTPASRKLQENVEFRLDPTALVCYYVGMKQNDTVKHEGHNWRIVAMFSDSKAMIERFRGRIATDHANVFGALITLIVPQSVLQPIDRRR